MYQLHLILKYLRKRRIAWVALGAVVLCTAMVLVVISIMGGWLRMFEDKAHVLSGDVVISGGDHGFAYYQQVIDRVKTLPEVDTAIPLVRSAGLMGIGKQSLDGVLVWGYPAELLPKVNRFPQSLYRQYKQYIEEAESVKSNPTRQTQLRHEADASAAHVSFAKPLSAEQYDQRIPRSSQWPGMIVSSGVLGINKTPDGKDVGRDSAKYLQPVKLSVVNMNAKNLTAPDAVSSRGFWIVDDSHTGVSMLDELNIYVPMDLLQVDLGMDGQFSGTKVVRPARVNQVHVQLKQGADPDVVIDKVQQVVSSVFAEESDRETREGLPAWSSYSPRVQTWRQSQAFFINVVQKQKMLVVFLFAMISVVAIFLIFCIFYMIVAEKTKDIGIIKSVGASDSGVAAVFLGYGLAIGVVGAGLGLLAGYVIVRNINQIHQLIGWAIGRPIWKSEVYLFDTIPSRMDPTETTVIVIVAIIASVAGSIVPAVRAARMHPIEALRWE